MKLTLDLHDIYNRGGDIDRALAAIIDEAEAKKARLVEIIPGKGSGALKKHVLRFLDRKDSRPATTGWRRTRRTSAGSSCTSAGSSRTGGGRAAQSVRARSLARTPRSTRTGTNWVTRAEDISP